MVQVVAALAAAVAATTVPATADRAHAASEQAHAASDRAHAASDRAHAASDRARAASEQTRAVAERARAAAPSPGPGLGGALWPGDGREQPGEPGYGSPEPPGRGTLGPGLIWRGCGDGLECAKLSVPVDWSRPRGPRTEIDVARMPARDPARSLGPLVVNTGEGSTVQAVRARPDTVSELARWFDVVFVEPRGIGDRGSTATVRCSVPPPDLRRIQLTPGKAAWSSYARDNAAYDRSCRIAAGPAYAGLTSWQVARDLDALRAALGQDRLRYFGNAYGAGYGRAYRELFPRRTGRMYLEGLPGDTGTGLGRRLIAHARAAERQLRSFRDWCVNLRGCPLDDDDALSVLDDLLERASAPQAREITAAVLAGLEPHRWPELAEAMSAAEEGDTSGLAALAAVAPPAGPGTVARSMWCHDFMPAVPNYAGFLAMEARLREVAPRVGWLTGRREIARCLGLRAGPGHPDGPARPGSVQPGAVGSGAAGSGALRSGAVGSGALGPGALGSDSVRSGSVRSGSARSGRAPSALVAIGRLDTGSPPPAARIPGARVLWHGDGHDAYLLQGAAKLRATCLRARVHDYLVNGVLPEPRTLCPGELTAGRE